MSHTGNPLATVQSGYDRWAQVYDHDANPLPALETPVVRGWAENVNGLQALDLGCGTGRHAIWLAAENATVTAVDFSSGMLAEAKLKPGADAIRFIEHDLHKALPFADKEYDLVVSGLVLEHLSDLQAFFGEIRRVLRSAGRAIVSAMHPDMFLRDSQARFTDPDSGEIIKPGSIDHSLSDMIMAAIHNRLQLSRIIEVAPDEEFARYFPRSEKYVDYPMLAVMEFTR